MPKYADHTFLLSLLENEAYEYLPVSLSVKFDIDKICRSV